MNDLDFLSLGMASNPYIDSICVSAIDIFLSGDELSFNSVKFTKLLGSIYSTWSVLVHLQLVQSEDDEHSSHSWRSSASLQAVIQCEAFSGVDTNCLQGNYTSYDILGYFDVRKTVTQVKVSFPEVEQFI